ncbi:MAG: N-acetylmuramoyl-L-alanine amidase, partial [Candidatus Eremiobacteraeota bacterium]|nr:N-acetylmuramoyl-L-alanine amidase [Candidatus Eremiobacteraeota bacterium]
MLRLTMRAIALTCLALACSVPLSASPRSLRGMLFVVDPGHGVRYPSGAPLNVGAVGPGGIEESKLTLAIAEDLAAELRGAGARVVLT